jgi:hypothetical protein
MQGNGCGSTVLLQAEQLTHLHTGLKALLLQACSGRGPYLQANDCRKLLLEIG